MSDGSRMGGGDAARAAEVAAAAERARDAGAALRQMGAARRAELIASAVQRLQREPDLGSAAEARALRHALRQSTGLSSPMIEWGLSSALSALDGDSLGKLAGQLAREAQGETLVAVVLSANVFTAPLRGLLLPLLAGAPVVCKASSRDDVLPRALAKVLGEVAPALGAALQVVTFGRGDGAALEALLAGATHLSVYGDDRTVRALQGQMREGTRLLAHGQGLGAVYIPWQALRTPRETMAVVRRVAVDVVAYDQRGCLSPHFVLLQPGGAVDGARFCELLNEHALVELEGMLPRGPLGEGALAAQMQWRGVAKACGVLHEGRTHAVSYEGKGAPRLSPGYRNLSVHDCTDVMDCADLLEEFGEHLKTVAVGGDSTLRQELGKQLALELDAQAPYLCAVGAMQTPPLNARADGRHPLWGLGVLAEAE